MESVIANPGLGALTSGSSKARPDGLAGVGTDDFLRLLVTQLRSQDPLEPMGNEELLRQIASVREIELSTTLSESLQTLVGQQRFASASSLIGHHVTAPADESGLAVSGIVSAVRFTEGGAPMLVLADGQEIPLDRVTTIQPPIEVARSLLGRGVIGLERGGAGEPRVVRGIVTDVRQSDAGEAMLELDTGDTIRFQDVLGTADIDELS